MSDRMPSLSNWKMPSVSPEEMSAYTAGSLKSRWSISTSIPRFLRMSATASRMTVSVRSPKKSIFKSPSASILCILYCVVMLSSFLLRTSGE